MYKSIPLLLFFFVSSYQIFGQDERFIRKEVLKSSRLKNIVTKQKKATWNLWSKHYQLDLNQDGQKERLQFHQKDGIDHLIVYEDDLSKIFEAPMRTWIGGGRPFKLRLVNLSKKVMALLIYYYEGNLDNVRTKSSARLYFLTIDNRDLSRMYLQKGPQFLDESKSLDGHYHVRDYQIKVVDFNGDGKKSIGLFYGTTSKIYEYLGRGQWSMI